MEICYNVMGTRRKKLVDVIAETTGAKAEYQFMPTCSYVIDYFTVTKDGTLIFDDRADSEEVEKVLEAIAAAGFACKPVCGADEEAGELSEEPATAPHSAIVALRHCEKIRWTKMTQDFSAMTRRRSAGILGVFQALTTKSEPKKTSQIVQIIFEQCLR